MTTIIPTEHPLPDPSQTCTLESSPFIDAWAGSPTPRPHMNGKTLMANLRADLDMKSNDSRSRYQTLRTGIHQRHIDRLQPEAQDKINRSAFSLLDVVGAKSYNLDAEKHSEVIGHMKVHGPTTIEEEDAASANCRPSLQGIRRDSGGLELVASWNEKEVVYQANISYDSADATSERIEPQLGLGIIKLFGKGGVDFEQQQKNSAKLGEELDPKEPNSPSVEGVLGGAPCDTKSKSLKLDTCEPLFVRPVLGDGVDANLIASKITEYEQLMVGSLVSSSFKKRIAEIIRILESCLQAKIETREDLSATLSNVDSEVEDELEQGYEDLREYCASITARKDVIQVEDFLAKSLLEEYGVGTIPSTVRVSKEWKLRGLYLEWKRVPLHDEKNQRIEAWLSQETGVPPSQLDDYLGSRLDRMISGLDLDENWVRGRIWNYANNHRRLFECDELAESCCWEVLARKILTDREQLELLIPENAVLADADRKSDQKGLIHFGIVCTQAQHFAKLKGPDNFILSKKAKERQREAERLDGARRKGKLNSNRQSGKLVVWKKQH